MLWRQQVSQLTAKRTAELLGFNDVLENSIDAVGSRDFILETQSALALLAVNLSRLAEDLIIWSQRRVWHRRVARRIHLNQQHHAAEKEP